MFRPETMLYRNSEALIDLDSSNTCKIYVDGCSFSLGYSAVLLLGLLHHPRSVAEVVNQVVSGSRQQLLVRDVMTDLLNLLEIGVISTEEKIGFSEKPWPAGGYDAAYVHLRMLNDHARKGAFVKAVHELVKNDDIVLDLGSGSGILAISAAQAGAAKVYAVEPSGMVGLARMNAERSGVGGKIEFIRDWSTKITLPEKASVLTTDLIGNDPLDMKLWETIEDARNRLLKPNARILPESFRCFATFYEAPSDYMQQHRATSDDVAKWFDWYGIDFSPMLTHDHRSWIGTYERPENINGWKKLSEPIELYQCSLSSSYHPFTVKVPVGHLPRRTNAVVISYLAQLNPNTAFDASPDSGSKHSHWYSAVWLHGHNSLDFDTQKKLTLEYNYRGDGSSQLNILEES